MWAKRGLSAFLVVIKLVSICHYSIYIAPFTSPVFYHCVVRNYGKATINLPREIYDQICNFVRTFHENMFPDNFEQRHLLCTSEGNMLRCVSTEVRLACQKILGKTYSATCFRRFMAEQKTDSDTVDDYSQAMLHSAATGATHYRQARPSSFFPSTFAFHYFRNAPTILVIYCINITQMSINASAATKHLLRRERTMPATAAVTVVTVVTVSRLVARLPAPAPATTPPSLRLRLKMHLQIL